MRIPVWLLRLLPMWDYICPKCKKKVNKTSTKCPYCGEQYGNPVRVPPTILKDHGQLEKYVHEHVFPRVSKAQRDYLAQYFTELFSDGFESGDVSEWDGNYGNESVVGSPVHSGSYSMEIDSSGSGVYELIGNDPCYLRFYFRFSSSPSSTATLAALCPGNYATCVILYLNTSNYLVLEAPSGSETDDTALSTSTWYYLEILRKAGSGDGEAKLWVNGQLKINKTSETITNNTYEVDVGCGWGNPVDSNYDDCIIADTYIGQESETYTKTWTADTLFKKLGITKSLAADATFQKRDIPKTFGLDTAFQESFIIQKQIDAFFKRLDATKTFGLDVHFGAAEAETYARTFGLDIIFAYKVRLPELWLDENGRIVLNISKPYAWVGT
jgi:hypothetical protein